jgi:predicted dehydrogenase
MASSSALRIGVIGLGAGAEPHLKSLADLSDTMQLVLAVTPSNARAAKRQAELPCPVSTDVNAVIGHADIDAVIIITPPSTHRDLTLRCLAAGKHVLVEKPLGLTSTDGEAMARAAEANGLVLAVMLQHRCRPGALRLRAALAEGALGEIVAAHCIVNWWRPQAYYDEPGRGTLARDGGGVLLTQAIHTIDLFRALVGVRDVVAAQATRTKVHSMETEDHVHALVTLDSGAPGAILASTAAYPGSPERIELFGTKGAASLIGGRLVLSLHDGTTGIVEVEGGNGGGSGASIMDFPHDAHRAIIADFGASIAGGRPPAAPAREALASQQLIDQILNRASFGTKRMS